MIGRVFNGRYQITERIGVGGMAEVYKATDKVLGRVVAVKVMLPQYASDPEFAARFRQEAASAANLQNPYIVNVYDWGQDEGVYFIVMEYVRGADLKSAIKLRGAINQRKCAEIGSQVCQALSTAHGLDIIHRDIKPQNIMVQPDGNVKVMDFGIARAKNSVSSKTSAVLGTAHYISPEQAQGKELTGTSDLYSLGCVLYESTTGQLPFDGPDAVSVAMKQVQEQPVPPSQINPDIHPDLEAIILKAMSKDPNARFQTARDMKACLDDFLMGRPVNLGGMAGAGATAMLGARGVGMAGAQTAVIGAGVNRPVIMPGQPGGTAVMDPIDSDTVTVNNPGQNRYIANKEAEARHKRNKTIGIVVGVLLALVVIAGLAIAAANGVFAAKDGVPDVTGKTQEAAISAIEDAGYKVGEITEEYSADVVAGRVISQDPKGGSSAESGTKVNLVISQGTEKVEVPDLTGCTAKEAEAKLEEAGLVGTPGDSDYSSTVDKNKVFKTDPEAGTQVDKGSTVTYCISLGKETADVPYVIGKDEDEATKALEDAGFVVSVADGGYSNDYDEGVVLSQTPNGGNLDKGTTVTISISKGQDPDTLPISIPNVIGYGASDAQETLQNAGFNVLTTEQYSDTYSANTVINQDQTGEAVKGTTITLTISKGAKPDSGDSGSDDSGSDDSSDDSSSSN